MSASEVIVAEQDSQVSHDLAVLSRGAEIAWLSSQCIPSVNHPRTSRRVPAEPDFQKLSDMKAIVDLIALAMGNTKVVSDEDRVAMDKLASEASMAAKVVDAEITKAEALPSNIPWRHKVKEQLEDLFCRIEDVAETAALVASKEFAELVNARINDLKNAESGNQSRA